MFYGYVVNNMKVQEQIRQILLFAHDEHQSVRWVIEDSYDPKFHEYSLLSVAMKYAVQEKRGIVISELAGVSSFKPRENIDVILSFAADKFSQTKLQRNKNSSNAYMV